MEIQASWCNIQKLLHYNLPWIYKWHCISHLEAVLQVNDSETRLQRPPMDHLRTEHAKVNFCTSVKRRMNRCNQQFLDSLNVLFKFLVHPCFYKVNIVLSIKIDIIYLTLLYNVPSCIKSSLGTFLPQNLKLFGYSSKYQPWLKIYDGVSHVWAPPAVIQSGESCKTFNH